MSNHQPTYRSVVQNLVAALEKQHGDNLVGWGIDAELGPLAEVYRQAKSLTAVDQPATIFATSGPRGEYDASIIDPGLGDISVVFVDETIFDKSGSQISIVRENGNVFTANVKMVIPSRPDFDTEKVIEVASREPFCEGGQFKNGMERAIGKFELWREESRPFHYRLMKTVERAIGEYGLDTYGEYLDTVVEDFKMGMLDRARSLDPGANQEQLEQRLVDWLERQPVSDKVEFQIAAAVYIRGVDKVIPAFESEPSQAMKL